MVNLNKTKTIVFRSRGVVNKCEKLYFEGEAIKVLTGYKNTHISLLVP